MHTLQVPESSAGKKVARTGTMQLQSIAPGLQISSLLVRTKGYLDHTPQALEFFLGVYNRILYVA